MNDTALPQENSERISSLERQIGEIGVSMSHIDETQSRLAATVDKLTDFVASNEETKERVTSAEREIERIKLRIAYGVGAGTAFYVAANTLLGLF